MPLLDRRREAHGLLAASQSVARRPLGARADAVRAAPPVELTLELPSGETVRARGEVVWVKPDNPPAGGGPKMGARFLEFLEGEEELYRVLGRA